MPYAWFARSQYTSGVTPPFRCNPLVVCAFSPELIGSPLQNSRDLRSSPVLLVLCAVLLKRFPDAESDAHAGGFPSCIESNPPA